MFTGFNSNVERDGQVYHVQTEDKGVNDPVVETRVYSGGQVVAAIRHSYADLSDVPDYNEDRIRRRMQEQHQRLIRNLELGRLEDEPDVRLMGEIADADNLVEEYLEDLLQTSVQSGPVLHLLEQGVDSSRTPRTLKKKR